MVHAHQRASFASLGIAHHQFRGGRLWPWAAGTGFGPQGAQGAVGSKDQGVDVHAKYLIMTNPSKAARKHQKSQFKFVIF
jgi:hypothetical protein